jgi:hypothetical protein
MTEGRDIANSGPALHSLQDSLTTRYRNLLIVNSKVNHVNPVSIFYLDRGLTINPYLGHNAPPSLSNYRAKFTNVVAGATLDTQTLIKGMGLSLLATDGTGRTHPQAPEAAFTPLRVNGVLDQFPADTGRALFLINVGDIFIPEVLKGA